MLVMKFGGSSVANKEQIDKVLGIVQGRLERSPVMVSSAHKGITNALVEAANAAAKGEANPTPVIDLQREIADSLDCPSDLLENFFDELADLLRGISLVKEVSPRSLDYVSSFGERMSTRVIANYFSRMGLKCKQFDAWELGFTTNDRFNEARPLKGFDDRVRAAFKEQVEEGVVPIITGFVGKTLEGEITTVGRNGSDLTASLFGAALGAEEVEIWSDTDGIMSADPRIVENAQSIPEMRFDEAAELAYFGSKVLHPSTLLPAMAKNIPVRVLNTNHPDHPGTVIREQAEPTPLPVTSIAHKSNQNVLVISSTSMLGHAGFLAKVFQVLGRHNVDIDMIATSEVSISMTTDNLDGLNDALGELEEFGHCVMHTEKTILAVVGHGMSRRYGLGEQILHALAVEGVNVHMLSYGVGSINFSMLIDDDGVGKAVPTLHRVLFGQ